MTKAKIYYARMDEFWNKQQKLEHLESIKSFKDIKWESIEPDAKYNWLLEGLHSEYEDFIPLGTQGARSTDGIAAYAIFKLYSNGVKTGRDSWAYNLIKKTWLKISSKPLIFTMVIF
jgi:predicted helicase